MLETGEQAPKVAEFLLQIKAIQIRPEDPFTWASGLKSPIYCDNRKTLSYPAIRTFIRQEATALIEARYGKPDAVVGVATGGIAMGALIAQELGVPFAYVRSKAKGHGMQNLIEGHLESGQSVVVIEDLVSTGKSSLTAVDALRAADIRIHGMVAVFTYGFDHAAKRFEEAGVDLVTLTNYPTLLEKALETDYVQDRHMKTLAEWRKDPAAWSATVENA